MSIATLVAWMWLAAQHTDQVKACTLDSSCMVVNGIDYFPVMQDAHPITPSKPQEHVIEIRTKRGIPDAKCIAQLKSVMPEWTPDVADVVLRKCTHNTREIWIDGQRWGVLRESEGK